MDKKEIILKRILEIDAEKLILEKELEELGNENQQILEMFIGCTIEQDKEEFPGEIFLMKGGRYLFGIEKPFLWWSSSIWDNFERKGMDFHKIQSNIKDVVEKHFGMEGLIPRLAHSQHEYLVEIHFSNKNSKK